MDEESRHRRPQFRLLIAAHYWICGSSLEYILICSAYGIVGGKGPPCPIGNVPTITSDECIAFDHVDLIRMTLDWVNIMLY